MPTQSDIARANRMFAEATGGRTPTAEERAFMSRTGFVPTPEARARFDTGGGGGNVPSIASDLLAIAAEANAAGIAAAQQQLALAEEALRLNAHRAERQDALLAKSLEQQAEFARAQIDLSEAQFGLQEEAFGLQAQRFQREEESARLQEMLRPILLEQAGIRAQRNEEGKIIGFEMDPDSLQARRVEVEEALLDRSLAALRGELPVSPALLRDLGEQESQLKENLRRQLGPGFETSTPGIESLAEFEQRRTETLEAARRGDLTMAEQLGINRQQSNQAAANNRISQGLTITNPNTQSQVGLPGVSFGQLPSVAQLFPAQSVDFPGGGLFNAGAGFAGPGASLAGLPAQLQNNLDVARITGQSRVDASAGDPFGSILGGLAAGIGGAIDFGAIGAAFLSHSSTKDVEGEVDENEVLDLVRDMGLNKWIYKGDDQVHMGPMAEDFHERFGVGEEGMIHMADVSGVSFAAIKALAKKFEEGQKGYITLEVNDG